MKKVLFLTILPFLLLGTAGVKAQVAIGSEEGPRKGAILDLKSTTQGLILPNVTLENIGSFQLAETPVEGMTVYNNNETTIGGEGKGIYVWNHNQWQFAGYRSGPVVIPVTGVTVTSPADVLLSGAAMQFTAAVAPDGATNKAVLWDVVPGTGTGTITNEGMFTAEAPGSVQIRATSAENAAIKDTKTITVTVPAVQVAGITVRSNGNATTVVVAGTLQLYADVVPVDADNKTVAWSSSNTEVATVNTTSGLVTARKNGTVRITATANDGSAWTGYIDLTITPVLVTGFTITPSATVIRKNGNVTLTAGNFTPIYAALKEVTWEFISGPTGSRMPEEETTTTTCAVWGGTAEGTVQIKVKAKDAGGYEKTYTIDVRPDIQVQSIALTGSTCVRNNNAKRIYPSSITPANALNKALSWSIEGGGRIESQDGEHCDIVADGSGGSITVTATATDGSGKTATYTSYGMVGVDEEGEILNDGPWQYTTWIFPNGIGRWMTKNSKHGTPTYQVLPNDYEGQGYWYNNKNTSSACLDGWRLPTSADAKKLIDWLKSTCGAPGYKDSWFTDGSGDGYWNTPDHFNNGRLYVGRYEAYKTYFTSDGTVSTPSAVNNDYYSVRCLTP
ncbi:MAG: Ig-like domain-containing protein [Dysgonamonadaceae bacterium]|nr:Ig-like domain-containing protein [Dysgonamonadaceae bacterium]